MGVIADAMVAYTQPLIDQTDGSIEQLNKAFALGQLCWNMALLSKEEQDKMLGKMRHDIGMDDDEYDEFRRDVVAPMLRRHHEMFPQLRPHFQRSRLQDVDSPWDRPNVDAPVEKYPGTERYAPCPCNSGRKYKFCCGTRSR